MSSALEGRHILVVEDEGLVAMLIEDVIADVGANLVGVCANVAAALAIVGDAEQPIDAALVDVNLGSEKSYPVAEALKARGVPFVFFTGYAPDGLETDWPGVPTLQKPFMEEALVAMMQRLVAAPDQAGA